jgi:hypothetical protein
MLPRSTRWLLRVLSRGLPKRFWARPARRGQDWARVNRAALTRVPALRASIPRATPVISDTPSRKDAEVLKKASSQPLTRKQTPLARGWRGHGSEAAGLRGARREKARDLHGSGKQTPAPQGGRLKPRPPMRPAISTRRSRPQQSRVTWGHIRSMQGPWRMGKCKPGRFSRRRNRTGLGAAAF